MTEGGNASSSERRLSMWLSEKKEMRSNAVVNFAYVNSKLEHHKVPEAILEGVINTRENTVVCLWTQDPEQMTSPDGKSWQDWRDNKRPSILTPEDDEDGYGDFEEFSWQLVESEWDVDRDEGPIAEMIEDVRKSSDEQLLRFTQEFWRRSFYNCLHDGLDELYWTLEVERQKLNRTLDYLKAMHQDMEGDFAWSEKNHLELLRRR